MTKIKFFKHLNLKRLLPRRRRLLALGILIVALAIMGALKFLSVKKAFAAPWAATMSGWNKRKQLTLVNTSGQTLHASSPYTITVNTSGGSKQANCYDVIVFYQPSETVATQLPTYAHAATGAVDCKVSTATSITFPLQTDLANAATSSYYYVYYGNSSATVQTGSLAPLAAFNVNTKSATFVAPFMGDTTALAAGSGTPTTATGAIRYGGGKSALSFDGVNDTVAGATSSTLNITDTITLEGWVNPSRVPAADGDYGIIRLNSGSSGILLEVRGGAKANKIGAWIKTTNNAWNNAITQSNIALNQNNWNHVALTYTSGALKLYINGQLDTTVTSHTGTISYIATPGYVVGDWGGTYFFPGSIDEVRVSNSVRYSANFSPPTAPFVRDQYTKLLLHFDENGTDPRGGAITYPAFDDSGNGNNGTITGAQYVDGLIGLNPQEGSTLTQSYASHQGIFIEEGTTNKVTNPSFENATSFSTNWTTGSGVDNYSTTNHTFTPAIAKRTPPAGPFAKGVMVQGNADGTAGDIISISPGTQIAGNFYQNFDGAQGSIVFWITPEWNGNDSITHEIFSANSGGRYLLRKDGTNVLQFYDGAANAFYGPSTASWVAGTTYSVVVSWDSKNILSTSNYVRFSVNGVHTFAAASYTSGTPTSLVLGRIAANAPNALIQGLTVYRRPLYEATTPSGINVGNGDEISQIYNSGTGKDPTLVTGSWDVVFALPTNSSTGSLSTTGEAWSHPHSSNLLGGTNGKFGFMMDGTYTNDGFTDVGTPTSVAALATAEKIFAGGYKIVSDAANEGIGATFPATNGGDYVIRAIGNSDGTSVPTVVITRADDTEITRLAGSIGTGRTAPDTLIFTFESPATENLKVKLINTATSGTTYWHQVEVQTNLFPNPSFETGSGDPWTPTGYTNFFLDAGDTANETTTIHSGANSVKYNTTADGGESFYKGGVWTLNQFYSLGGWFYGNGTTSSRVKGFSGFHVYQNTANTGISLNGTSASWSHQTGVFRAKVADFIYFYGNAVTAYLDDVYSVSLTDVTLTVTPAIESNSTEASGLRVDGKDYLTMPVANLTASSGSISFKFTPRHSFAVGNLFGSTAPVLAEAYGNSNNYIKLYWQSSTNLRLDGKFNGGTTISANYATPTLNAGTTYTFKITYLTSGNLALYVGDMVTAKGTVAMSTNAFLSTAIPATMFFGSDDTGVNQYDGTFDTVTITAPTLTANTTAPYYKFGAQSSSLVNTDSSNLVSSLTPASTAAHTLSAYVYDGTAANVGGTVDSKVASLVFDGEAVSTTYTDTGGGWWRLSYTPTYTGKVASYNSLNQDTDQGLYTTAANKWLSQGFKTTQTVTADTVNLYLKKVGAGTPTTTHYQVTIQTDSAGVPSGTISATSNCKAVVTSTSYAQTPFTFASPPTLTSGTQYHLVIKPYTENTCVTQQSALNATNYISWGYDTSASSYGSGDRSTGTGSAWTAVTGADHIFQVFSPQAALNYGVHAADSKTVYVDGVQLEAKAYATTYTDGSLGSSYAWTGTANNSTSTRTIAQLKYSAASSLSNTAGTVSFWMKRPYSFTPPGNGMGLFGAYNWWGGTGLSMYYNSTNIMFSDASGSSGASKSVSFTANQWFHVVGTWDNSVPQIKVYVNAAVGNSGNGTIGALTANFSLDDVGNLTSGRPSDAVISDFRIYNTNLADQDITDLYYKGLASHQEQVVASEAYSDGTPPILNWHMDESNGTTVYDSSIYQNNGTLGVGTSAPSWETGITINSQDPASLKFDGSNDYVSRAYTQDSELDVGTASFSVSGWFHHSSTIAGTDTLISRYSSGGYKVYMNSSGFMCFGVDDDSSWGPDDSACTTTSYADSNWHYIEVVIARGVSPEAISLYIDGVLKASNSSLTITGSLSGSSPAFYVGIDSDGVSNPWDGYIDEIKVFDIARTLAQAKTGTIGSESVKGVSASFGSEDPNKSLTQGLVGWWKMDENTGTTTADGSGNANTGTLGVGSSAPTWASGKFGSGLTFDGTNDYVSVTENSSLPAYSQGTYSVALWVKGAANQSDVRVFSEGSSTSNNPLFTIGTDNQSSNKVAIYIRDNNSVVQMEHSLSTTAVFDNAWHHLVWTDTNGSAKLYIDGVQDSTNFAYTKSASMSLNRTSIGSVLRASPSNYFAGSLDDVRVYTRALSPAEVLQLYKYAPGPVGWWSFDDGSGLSAADKSGNGNTGTLGAGTAAPIWTTGKYGKGLSFDGTNDYVLATSVISVPNVTVEAWIKTTVSSYSVGGTIVDGRYNQPGPFFFTVNGNKPAVWLYATSGATNFAATTAVNNGNWHHVAFNYDGTTGKIFVDGRQENSTTAVSGNLISMPSAPRIGMETNRWYFNGSIDDVRIYNYARTPEQIIEDMIGSPKSVAGGGGTRQPAVAYYKFDEGQGTTANNFGNGGSTINGTLGVGSSAPSWSNSGKYIKALSFDGSNDYVYTSNLAIIAGNSQTYTSVSWGGWFNPSTGVATKTLIHKGNEFKLTTDANSKANCAIYSSTWQTASVASSALPLSSWSHVLCTYDGANIKVYINGNQSGTTPAQTGLITSINTTPLNIGREPSTNYYQGSIDEVKIYTYALSSDEVGVEYNQGTAQVLGALGTNSTYAPQAANQEYCVPGDGSTCSPPVGEWKMDEKTGNYARDTSGNNYDGYLGNGTALNMPTWTNGKLGSGLKFDGVNDEVRIADNDVFSFTNGTNDLPFTLSSWVYYKAGGGASPWGSIIGKYYTTSPVSAEWSFGIMPTSSFGSAGSDQLYFQVSNSDSGNTRLRVESTTSIPKNQWVFVTATYNGSGVNTGLNLYFNGQLMAVDRQTQGTYIKMGNLASPVQIGALLTGDSLYNSYLNGSLDQVRIFNYARTPAQIAWDYNRGAPVAWYKFDECSGTVAHSTNDPYNSTLNGTITIGPSGSQTSQGACSSGTTTEAWNNGTTGKFNGSLNFDGTDDYTQINDSSDLFDFDNNFSVGVWFKTTNSGNIETIISRGTTNDFQYFVGKNASNQLWCKVYQSNSGNNYLETTTTTTINDGNWHNVNCIVSNTTLYAYLDGKLVDTDNTPTGTRDTASNGELYIGKFDFSSTYPFSGQLDEVRIYNYALTGTQVKDIYNCGAVRFSN